MNQFKALLKKEWVAKLAPFKKEKRDLFSILINIFLTLSVCAVLIIVFGVFVNTYINVKIGFESAVIQRQFELITILVAMVLIMNIIVGTFKVNHSISDYSSWHSLLSLPVEKSDIFKAKLIFVYFDLLLLTLLTMVPLCVTFCIVSSASVLYLLGALAVSFVIPIIALFLCSLLALPVFYVKKLLTKNYIVTAILFCLILVGFFYLYSIILGVVKSLLETGQIKFIFNEQNITLIQNVTSNLYPANILAEFVMFNNVWLNLLWIVLITAGCLVITYFATKYIFDKASKSQLLNVKDYTNKKLSYSKKNSFVTLLNKEFISVLRTPSFSFQYFATTISLPLMIFVTCSLITSLVDKLIFIDCSFEIAVITIAMFSILTNTFCATNISREKRYFNLTKTLPIDYRKIVFSKVAFCSIASVGSIFVSVLALIIGGYVNVLQGLISFIITSLLSIGIICYATRQDLNKPDFDNPSGGPAVSFVIFFGLIISACVAIIALMCSLLIKTAMNPILGEVVGAGILFVFAILVFVLSIVYLLKKLGGKYRRTVA